jgi:hypothetical protein
VRFPRLVGRSASPRGAAILALAILVTSAPGQASAEPSRAILLRGADPVKGLPFFAPNAIAALTGAYSLGKAQAPVVALWFSRESLVYDSSWKRLDPREGGPYAEAAYSLPRGPGSVLALKSEGYTLFFELPGDPREAAFTRAFSRKFPVFFRYAASDAELSFPAYVDY